MPANLSPEYKDAQEKFRRARDPQEKLEWLREMLRTIPKHKGTEHLQAEIKTRVKELADELGGPKKGAVRGGPELAVRHEGAAQVALVGPPNSGKSRLHARLTGSHAVVGPYPFSTKYPLPGMLLHEDVQFQVVDLPPVAEDYFEPWMGGTLHGADAVALVVDLSDPACVEQLDAIERRLEEKRVSLVPRLDAPVPLAPGEEEGEAGFDPFRARLPALLLANKADLIPDPGAELAAFREIAPDPFDSLAVSAETGAGLAAIGPALFSLLGIVRIYSKVPGHPPDMGRPFTLRGGGRVRDVAQQVHRGMAAELRFARIWGGSAEFDGQQVSAAHVVRDRDVVELHW
ncbi:MAG TPA: GTPase [Vicinamibacteria bacterium]|nr:GTPase [Vicinamibacteria bacterium]